MVDITKNYLFKSVPTEKSECLKQFERFIEHQGGNLELNDIGMYKDGAVAYALGVWYMAWDSALTAHKKGTIRFSDVGRSVENITLFYETRKSVTGKSLTKNISTEKCEICGIQSHDLTVFTKLVTQPKNGIRHESIVCKKCIGDTQ